MKKQLISLSLLATCISINAFAVGPVANIQVSGDIKPPTCVVNAGDNDLLYELGNISPTIIPSNNVYKSLPAISNNITVICDSSTYLTFKAVDNYSNDIVLPPGYHSLATGYTFNLVNKSNISTNIGGVAFMWSNVFVDGEKAFISRANDGLNDNGVYAGPYRLLKEATNGWTKTQQQYVSPLSLNLISGKTFSTDLSIRPDETYIYSKNTLTANSVDLSNGVDYVGQVILTFNFGV